MSKYPVKITLTHISNQRDTVISKFTHSPSMILYVNNFSIILLRIEHENFWFMHWFALQLGMILDLLLSSPSIDAWPFITEMFHLLTVRSHLFDNNSPAACKICRPRTEHSSHGSSESRSCSLVSPTSGSPQV